MNSIKQMIILTLSGILFTAFTEPEEITLQNGLGQYSGCSDTYLSCSNPNTNYGDSKTLKIRCDGG
jgi:hypothetical protein